MPAKYENQTGSQSDNASRENATDALADLPETGLAPDQCAQVKGGVVMKAGSDNITLENFVNAPRGFNPKELSVDK